MTRGALRNPIVWGPVLASGVILIFAVVYLGPLILVGHIAGLGAEQRAKAMSDARTSLAAVASAFVLSTSVIAAVLTFRLNRAGQETDRYQTGITQLGDEHLAVRVGGIYALARLSKETDWARSSISRTLLTFIRDGAQAPHRLFGRSYPASPAEDVQAALTVLTRSTPGEFRPLLNLSGIVLVGADLHGASLYGANLAKTRLDKANLADARLQEAVLAGSRLRGAKLFNAHLEGADLTDADLRSAKLYKTDFANARLVRCRLSGCNLKEALNLTEAQLATTRR
jgi:hypothetical protein